MVDIFKHVGTTHLDRERLKMSVNTPASWSAHALRMPIGPAALRGLTRLKCLTHVYHGAEEPTVLGSRPCRWHCVILKAGEEV
jgi:hypothetical protein